MRVDGLEVEFAGDQEDDRLDGGQPREAASAALGVAWNRPLMASRKPLVWRVRA